MNHHKTKKMHKISVKKLSFVIKYVPDQYKTKNCVMKLFKKMVEFQGLFRTATKIKSLR